MIRIILIRHGHTAWNEGEGQAPRFRGTVDLPLAPNGVLQARTTAHRLAGQRLDAIYASPLQRATHTAQIVAEPHGLAVQVLPGLNSMNYGNWAGHTPAQVAQDWPDLFRRWRHDPFSVQIPGGDNAGALDQRAWQALQQILGQQDDGETVVIVSHQVIIKLLICRLAGLPGPGFWHIRQDLCNLSSFDYDPVSGAFALAGLNDICHLNPLLPRASGDGTRILLIRHGQTAWNAGAGEERFRGRTDLPLDDSGQAQAAATAGRLGSEPIAALYASPLLRARQTAAPLARKLGLDVVPHEGLLDIDYGRFQGLSHAQAAAAYPELYALWRTTPGQVAFPSGESLDTVQRRLLALLDELAARHPGQTVGLVGHQIVNKILACTLLHLALDRIWQIRQDTTAIDVFQQSRDDWHTLCLNDTCHLT
jgi:broad specificity phosphatase PhoE